MTSLLLSKFNTRLGWSPHCCACLGPRGDERHRVTDSVDKYYTQPATFNLFPLPVPTSRYTEADTRKFQSRKGTSDFIGEHKGPGRGRALGSLRKLLVKMRLAFRSALFTGRHCSGTDRPRGLAHMKGTLVTYGFSSHSFSSMGPDRDPS